jgi:hypothetical protein
MSLFDTLSKRIYKVLERRSDRVLIESVDELKDRFYRPLGHLETRLQLIKQFYVYRTIRGGKEQFSFSLNDSFKWLEGSSFTAAYLAEECSQNIEAGRWEWDSRMSDWKTRIRVSIDRPEWMWGIEK